MGVAKQRNKAQPNVKLYMNIDPDLTAVARELHVMETNTLVVAEHFIGQHIVSRNAALPVTRHRIRAIGGMQQSKKYQKGVEGFSQKSRGQHGQNYR